MSELLQATSDLCSMHAMRVEAGRSAAHACLALARPHGNSLLGAALLGVGVGLLLVESRVRGHLKCF